MTSRPLRIARGSALLVRALASEPHLVSDLPKWLADASIRKNPLEYRKPWWNFRVIEYVEGRLPPSARVFEYGGGASTLWLRDRGASVTTVEDNEVWLAALRERLPDADVLYVPSPGGDATVEEPFEEYVHTIDREPDDSVDLVIVDGKARRDCVLAGAPKVKAGGMVLLDDSQASDTSPVSRAEPTRLRDIYEDLPHMLSGWDVKHFRGFKPGTWLPVQTTVWTRR